MANIRTHYDNLKVARNAPNSVIKAAYKALCQTYHPDKFQGSNAEAERIMKLINTSYVVLTDPVKRAEHDVWIREKEADTNQQYEKETFGETWETTDKTYKKQEKKQKPLSKDNASLHKWWRYFGLILFISVTYSNIKKDNSPIQQLKQQIKAVSKPQNKVITLQKNMYDYSPFEIYFFGINNSRIMRNDETKKILNTNVTVKNKIFQKGLFKNCKDNDDYMPRLCLCKAETYYLTIEGLKNKLAQEKINKTLKSLTEEDGCDGTLTNDAEMESGNYSTKNYEITFESNAVLSIQYNSKTYYFGAAHIIESTKGFLIDINTGDLLTVSDIFGKNISKVNEFIYNNLKGRENALPEEIEKLKGKFLDIDNSTLLIVPEGVKIVFPVYSVENYLSDMPELLIPKKYISKQLYATLFRPTH